MVDPVSVRVSLLVYGVLYVVLEVVGYHLEQLGWTDVSALDVATAVTDALLVLAVCAAVLVGLDLATQWWRRWSVARQPERIRLLGEVWEKPTEDAPARRQAPLAVAAERVEAPPKRAYTGNPYSFAGHRFPEDPGSLL